MNDSINSLSNKRGKYYKYIFEYKKRRAIRKKKLEEAQIEYRNSVAQINKKIKLWGREIRRIDERYRKIQKLKKAITIFTGYDLKTRNKKKDIKSRELARGLYYKYGLEHKMQGKELREVAGFSRVQQPTECRRWMTKQIVSDPKMRQQWENFKELMKKA